MKQIRATEVTRAAVQYQGVMTGDGKPRLKPAGGKRGGGSGPVKISVHDMIDEIQAQFQISDAEALYIRQVTEEKIADPVIRSTVKDHRDDSAFLFGTFQDQVDRGIQETYQDHGRFEELADEKYVGVGGIFDIMAVTVIQTHLTS